MTARDAMLALKDRISRSIIGQEVIVERLVIGLLANGNMLLEGLPGLAKTRAVKSLARNMEAEFSRIQFTPDLLPSDVTGTEVLHQTGGEVSFRFEAGPIFANIVLADEINRSPAKVQAALLEAMEERQVTVAGTVHKMPDLFMVMATQNPVEQEGTYPLPEAQMDRFLMHVYIDYPDESLGGRDHPAGAREEVTAQLGTRRREDRRRGRAGVPRRLVFDGARGDRRASEVGDVIEKYMVDLITATRDPGPLFSEELSGWIEIGVPAPAAASDWTGAARDASLARTIATT